MTDKRIRAPKIEFVPPPPIKWYGVSGDQLDRIEEACSDVGHDLSFALAAGSVGVTSLITYFSVSQLTSKQRIIFVAVMVISAALFLYTGIRWFRTRNKAKRLIDAIRASDQPESE